MDGFAANAIPAAMVSSGFLPAGSLLELLIQICNELSSLEKKSFIQIKNISNMARRIRRLYSLFEEVSEVDKPLPPSTILCLTELLSVFQRVKILTESCRDDSLLWNLLQTEYISNQFYALVKMMVRALDILPLSLLPLTADTREQVELLHKQAKRDQLFVDQREIQRRDEINQLMSIFSTQINKKNKELIDLRRAGDVLGSVGLRSPSEFDEEMSKLEAEAKKQAGTGGLIVISNIKNLISLISFVKLTIFSQDDHLKAHEDPKKRKIPMHGAGYQLSLSHSMPDEFRCPISLDLMNDPVIIASGHTYDRNSIAQWINTGHHTCPKSGQKLIHMALIPNFALKSLIHQWRLENNIPILESTSSSDVEGNTLKKRSSETLIDHISATKGVTDAVKMTAEFLVGKLATGSADIRRQAAYELRLLAKSGTDNRRIIAEAGAIPFLSTLLCSRDSRIQENSVTALLNLSIHNNNKVLIMAAGALDNIVEVLQSGLTTEAKENAAASIFSLSLMDEYKITIGAHPRVIPALVQLLGEASATGKRDAATALFNLAVISVNREKVILAGAVPLLIGLLTDDKAGITDDALALLALLLGCPEGLEEIKKNKVFVPILIELLRFGSSKGKENSITLLLGLCKDGGEEVARRLLMNPRSIPSLQSLATDGSLRARRKAHAVLRILNRYCSQITKTDG
ncbi:U-box domain-containing protein 1-like [Andrographis paniculata]|uniref:U-box domain-containing protein 1-like n=1 Tax=Andrographis paniculata TaxID=175694 RepID=UPI0021E71FBC|nr:U-box domain-containing protein 1-like [Andrographis paniculata]